MKRQPAVLRSLSLREAVIPISSRNRQSMPWNSLTKNVVVGAGDLRALQAR